MRRIGNIILAASLAGSLVALVGCKDDALHAWERQERRAEQIIPTQQPLPVTTTNRYTPLERVVADEYGPANERKWVADAIGWSRKNRDYALVIDKAAYTLQVYKDGENIAEYAIELGKDPIDPKEREDDFRTPEGRYTIEWRRDGDSPKGKTAFYKSLLIDYPNADDRLLGRTGSAIEIHGTGSGLPGNAGGENWTDGCIALSNEDIDNLFSYKDRWKSIGHGTPVVIVYGAADRTQVTDAR